MDNTQIEKILQQYDALVEIENEFGDLTREIYYSVIKKLDYSFGRFIAILECRQLRDKVMARLRVHVEGNPHWDKHLQYIEYKLYYEYVMFCITSGLITEKLAELSGIHEEIFVKDDNFHAFENFEAQFLQGSGESLQ